MTTYRWSSVRRRRAVAETNDKHYVIHHHGKPVASSTDVMKARGHVQSKVDLSVTHSSTTWTSSGKFFIDRRWTGWEVREVAAL